MINCFFFKEREFQPFQCRWRLNPRSLIQLSETLPVKLTRTHVINCLVLELEIFYIFRLLLWVGFSMDPFSGLIISIIFHRLCYIADCMLNFQCFLLQHAAYPNLDGSTPFYDSHGGQHLTFIYQSIFSSHPITIFFPLNLDVELKFLLSS